MMPSPEKEIEYLKGLVARRFPVYDVRVRPQVLSFYVNADLLTLETKFDELRRDLVPQGYIPIITKEGGEHVVHLQKRPPVRFMSNRVNLAMLTLTITTTLIAGALAWASYKELDWLTPAAFLFGFLTFSLPLLAILGVHEMGHYFTAKKYKVNASLPFFIPSMPPLGTLGAVISMRDPIPSKKALVDIGASGPLAGLAVAIPVTALGLWLMAMDPKVAPPNPGGNWVANFPVLYELMYYGLRPFISLPDNVVFHPTAFAGWVGLFVTAMNLLPAGQLDGGHIARALLGERAKYVSFLTIAAMFIMGVYWYAGWWFIALFLMLFGLRHPPPLNDLTPLKPNRKVLGAFAAFVLVLTIVFQPMEYVVPQAGLEIRAPTSDEVMSNATLEIPAGSTVLFQYAVVNVGNVAANVTMRINANNLENLGWNLSFERLTIDNRTELFPENPRVSFEFDSGMRATADISVTVPSSTPPSTWTFSVAIDQRDGPSLVLPVEIIVS